MDPKKNRRWLAAGLAAGALVFVVTATGEWATAASRAASTTSAEAVLASDSGGPENGGAENGGTDSGAPGRADGADNVETVDRGAVIESLQALLETLGISPQELDEQVGAGEDAGGAAGADAEGATGGTITISNFAFGQPITVAPGATVEARNNDSAQHNVTASDGSFETRNIAQGEAATFTAPNKPGRYEFTCTLHPEMTGTLVVEEGAGTGRGDRNGAGAGRSSAPDKQREGGAGSGGGAHGSDTTGTAGHRDSEPSQAPRTSAGGGYGDGY